MPVLIGFNSDEGALFGGPVTTSAYEAAVTGRYGPFAAYTEASPRAMIFHERPAAGALPDPQHFDVLDRYFGWRRSPEGEQP